MDNLPAHKTAPVRAAIDVAGRPLFLLPPYSADMNPIEMAFAKLKTLLRQAPVRTIDGPGDVSALCSINSLPVSAPITSQAQNSRQRPADIRPCEAGRRARFDAAGFVCTDRRSWITGARPGPPERRVRVRRSRF